MNIVDFIIIAILIIFTFLGIYKGLVLSVFKFFSFIISIYFSTKLYPIISELLIKNTFFYNKIKTIISQNISFEKVVGDVTKTAEAEIIKSLTLPDFLKDIILKNNNSEIYNIVGAKTIDDYILNFLTNTIINIISLIIVFILVSVLIAICGQTLNIISKLPIANTLNKTGGGIFGFCQGGVLVFVSVLILYTFAIYKNNSDFFKLLDSSVLVNYLYSDKFITNILSF